MKSVHVCFTIRFRKLTSAAANLAAHLMPVNNFFAHWDKEIDMTKVQIKASYQQQRPKKSIDILNPCLSSAKRHAKSMTQNKKPMAILTIGLQSLEHKLTINTRIEFH